jgi:hypothetical protein
MIAMAAMPSVAQASLPAVENNGAKRRHLFIFLKRAALRATM